MVYDKFIDVTKKDACISIFPYVPSHYDNKRKIRNFFKLWLGHTIHNKENLLPKANKGIKIDLKAKGFQPKLCQYKGIQ